MDSEEGPRPVYKKNGLFCSYAFKISGMSLENNCRFKRVWSSVPVGEENLSSEEVMRRFLSDGFNTLQQGVFDTFTTKLDCKGEQSHESREVI